MRRILRTLAELTVSFAPGDALVLCYHGVSSRAMFQAHLVLLEDAGYRPITLDRFKRWRAGGGGDEPRGALLTFDGGTRDQLDHALPVLDARGVQGIFFPPTLGLDSTAAGGVPTMRRADVAALARAGHVVGGHSHTHPDLTRLTAAAVEREVLTSKRLLEDATAGPVDTFCYPYGAHSPTVRAIVGRAGFALAFTVELGGIGPRRDPLALPRLCVLGAPSLSQFRAALSGRLGVPGSLLLYWKLRLRLAPR